MPPVDRIVENPHWNWMIVVYFFFGGIAAGSAFIGALAALVGGERMKPVVWWAAVIPFPLLSICGILLIADLGRPERFWHMLIQNNTFWPMFKYWSPMSYGSWILLAFSGLAFVNFVAALVAGRENGIFGSLQFIPRLIGGGILGTIFQVLLLVVGYLFGSYTGALVTATNQPIWSDTSMLGALFFISGVSAALSVLILIMLFARQRHDHEVVAQLETADNWAMLLELVIIGAFLLFLGSLAWPFLGHRYGLTLLIGTVGLGLLVPLLLHWRPKLLGNASPMLAAALALIGGYALRYAIVYAGQEITIAGRMQG
jgi:formate-dependent nitrite reductase membrane component NrfD